MSTSTAMTIITASNTTIATQAAIRAKIIHCKVIEKTFDPIEATTNQKQEYAECIKELYPTSIGPGIIILLKIVFVVGLMSALVGGYKEYKRDYADWIGIITLSTIYGLGIPALICIVLGVIVGIFWVLGIQL